jgi:type II pantothenate kinase
MPELPILADPSHYRPCIQDLLGDGPRVREYWLALFERHVVTLAGLPLHDGRFDDHSRWPAFRQEYLAGLADLRRSPGSRGELTVLELTRYREEQLRACGFFDPFDVLKQRENRLALKMLPAYLRELDALPPRDRIEQLARGLFAGNQFDMGSPAVVDAFERGTFDFHAACARLPRRPWAVDDFDAWANRWRQEDRAYRRVLFFVDNAGPDIVLGAIPWARFLAGRGADVVLAANSGPALNDVTATELRGLLRTCGELDAVLGAQLDAGRVRAVESGCTSPLIDLGRITQECCDAARASDLLILEGMGRAVESNYDARFTVDTLKLALIKDPMVAEIIGVKLFDPIFRFERRP